MKRAESPLTEKGRSLTKKSKGTSGKRRKEDLGSHLLP